MGRGLGWVGQTDLDKWIVNALGAPGALLDSVLHVPSVPNVLSHALGSQQDNVILEYELLAQSLNTHDDRRWKIMHKKLKNNKYEKKLESSIDANN